MDTVTKTDQKAAASTEAPAAADKRASPSKEQSSGNMNNQQQTEFRLGEQGLLQVKKKINLNAPVFSPTSFPLGPLGESIPGYDEAGAKKKKKKSKKKKQATEESAPAEAAKDSNDEDKKVDESDRVERNEEKKEMVWVVKDKTKQQKKSAGGKVKDAGTASDEKATVPVIEVQESQDAPKDDENKLKKEDDKKAPVENPEASRTALAWEAKEERRVAFKPEQNDDDQAAAEESKQFLTPGNRSSQGREKRREGGRSASNKGRRDSSNKNERKAQFKIISRGRGQREAKPVRGGFGAASSSSAKSSRSNSVRGNSSNRQQSGIVGGQLQPGFAYKPVGSVPKSFDPLGAYKPPFKVRERSRHHSNMVDALEAEENKLPKNSYSLEFVFGLKQNNKQRPMNMAELDFPSKKKVSTRHRKNLLTEKDKFNKFVGDIRILLNKLSTNNFDTISQRLLNNFQYTPSLLYELMKMIFLKSTLEHAYLDVYVRLCTLLFKRFKDDENHELNFKKLLINKCQSQFYKMLKKKEEKRRRESLEIEGAGKEEVKDVDGDYSIPMMMLYDDEEMEERKKEQMLGNMYLITELHVAKQLSGSIIKACIDDLQMEINDQNVEILCYMVSRLMVHLCKVEMSIGELDPDKKPQRRSSLKEINLIFCDKILQWLFQYRHDKVLSSRTKFKIQDLIDAYNEEWKQFITLFKARDAKDESKPLTAYVPKNQILTEHQVFCRGSSRKSSGNANIKGYFYRPKSISNEFVQDAKPAFGKGGAPKPGELANLFSALKADGDDVRLREAGRSSDEDSEDEDFGKLVGRRISMNQDNKTGQDFESHLAHGPGEGVLREIQNMFNEYRESENKEHAKEELSEICDKHSIPRHQFVGYFLSNSLSEKPEDFRHLMNLVFEYFYLDQKLLDARQMKDSINVCVANLPDLTIDYPNARAYATEMLLKAKDLKVIDADSAALYVSHVENMNDMEEEGSDSD